MGSSKRCGSFGFILLMLASAFGQTRDISAIPRVVKFSGAVPAGASSATFAIYATQDSSTPLWLETQSVTSDDTGHYTVLLGATKPDGLPASIFASGEARWIGVKIGDAPESARSLLVSVPYALKAGDAETLGGKPLSAFLLSDLSTTNASGSATGTSKTQRLKSNAETGRANPDPTAPGDSGTQNHLAKFLPDGTTLGNAALVEIGGRLGIGTTFPNFPLELVGSNVELLQRNPDPSGYSGMRFYNDQNTALHALEIDYSGSAYPSALIGAGPVGEQSSITNNGPFPMTFGTNNVARVTIAGSGNVGIGTITPTAALDVNGIVRANGGFKFPDGTTQTSAATTCSSNCGGTISGVTAGSGLTGGGTSGTVTIAVDGTVVRTSDSRLTDSRAPNPGSSSYIQNNPASAQTASVNITGNVTAGSFTGSGDGLSGLHQLAVASADPLCAGSSTGSVYFNTTSNSLRYCDGTQYTDFAPRLYSDGGKYCGSTAASSGQINGATGGQGYRQAKLLCESTCNSAQAHMCTAGELVRGSQLGTTQPGARAWFADGNTDCSGWSSTAGSASTWQGNTNAASATCSSSLPVACCK